MVRRLEAIIGNLNSGGGESSTFDGDVGFSVPQIDMAVGEFSARLD